MTGELKLVWIPANFFAERGLFIVAESIDDAFELAYKNPSFDHINWEKMLWRHNIDVFKTHMWIAKSDSPINLEGFERGHVVSIEEGMERGFYEKCGKQ